MVTNVGALAGERSDQVFIGSDNTAATLQEWYVLKMGEGGKPIFGTSFKPLEAVPSDDWEVRVRDFSGGLGGALAGGRNICVEPGRVTLAPSIAGLNLSADQVVDKPLRYPLELQDSNGRWYLYLFSENHIVKADLGVDPPVLRQIYDIADGSPWDANDHIGQPVVGVDSGTDALYIPLNNGNRIMKMTLPVEVDTGAGSGDTFTAVTAVVEGGAHFEQLASGKIARCNSTHSSGTFQNRAEVSLLAANGDFETDGDWGADFPIAGQVDWFLGVMSIEDLMLIRKSDDRWYVAVELEDATIQFRSLLTDEIAPKRFDLGSERNHKGVLWHGRAYLPTAPHLWRHNLSSAIPVGMETLPSVPGSDMPSQTDPRGGYCGALAPAGKWLYATFDTEDVFWVMHGRERGPGDPPGGELVWLPLWSSTKSRAHRAQLLHVQLNGEGAPRLWWGFDNEAANDQDLTYIDLALDGGPWKAGGEFGTLNEDGFIVLDDVLFESEAMLREARVYFEHGAAALEWKVNIRFIDPGGSFTALAGTSAITTTPGSLYATRGSGDQGRRLRAYIHMDNTTVNADTTPPTLYELRMQGHYLPDVGKIFEFVIDVTETAKRTDRTVEEVVSDVEAFVNSPQDWIDRFSNAGDILIRSVEHLQGKRVAGVVAGPQDIRVRAELLEYS